MELIGRCTRKGNHLNMKVNFDLELYSDGTYGTNDTIFIENFCFPPKKSRVGTEMPIASASGKFKILDKVGYNTWKVEFTSSEWYFTEGTIEKTMVTEIKISPGEFCVSGVVNTSRYDKFSKGLFSKQQEVANGLLNYFKNS